MQLKLLMGAVGIILTLFVFQNCGKAGFDGQTTTTDEASTAMDVDPKFKNLTSFPYDISINQLAFTNCSAPQSQNSGGDFTFKVGAYDNKGTPAEYLNIATAGISLRPEFLAEFDAIATKAYIKDLHASKLKEVLSFHPLAYGVQPYLGIHEQQYPRTKEITYADRPDQQRALMLGSLSQIGFIDQLVANKKNKFHFFSQAPVASQRYLEGAISFPFGSKDGNTDVSQVIASQGFLSLGFHNSNKTGASSNSDVELLGPDTTEAAFGRGLYFGLVSPTNDGNKFQNSGLVINEERDLATGVTTNGRWDCTKRFKIVAEPDRMKCVFKDPQKAGSYVSSGEWTQMCKNASKDSLKLFLMNLDKSLADSNVNKFKFTDVDNYVDAAYNYMEPACPPMDYSDNFASAEDVATYHLLRRFLPADNWDINLKYKCVVPKRGICYNTNVTRIYDERFFNTFPTASGIAGYPSATGTGQPNNYFTSIDYKGNPNVNFHLGGMESALGAVGIKHPDIVCSEDNGGGFECAKYLTMCVKFNN